MRRLAWDSSFRRAFKRRIRNDAALQEKIFDALDRLVSDPYSPDLRTHKLLGQLDGLWACWVEYDCRIIFAFEADPQEIDELIVLIDIGTHD